MSYLTHDRKKSKSLNEFSLVLRGEKNPTRLDRRIRVFYALLDNRRPVHERQRVVFQKKNTRGIAVLQRRVIYVF